MRRFHSQSISLPVSPSETSRNSFCGDNENLTGGPSLRSPLYDELNQAMKGNFFATELTNSPETEIANNPLDAVAVGNRRKRKSTSLLFNQKPTPDAEAQNIEQGLEDILNEVADLVEDKVVQQKETSHQREEVLLAEIKALKDNQAHLENA